MKKPVLVLGAIAVLAAASMSPSQDALKEKMIRWEPKADPGRTGADGEGTSVWKADGGEYYLVACTGYSGKGEYYTLFCSETLTGFQDLGKIDMDVPAFASGAFGHGDVIRHGDEVWFYFQGTRDGGKTFRIGLATHKAAIPFRAVAPSAR